MAFFLLIVSLLLSIPFVQTQLAKFATQRINNDFGTNILVKKVDLSFLGNVDLKDVEVRDDKKDTLIFIGRLRTSLLNSKKILDGEVDLSDVSLKDAKFYIHTYKGDKKSNFDKFLASFDSDTPKDSSAPPFKLKTSNIYLDNLNFRLTDDNKRNKEVVTIKRIGGNLQSFSLIGDSVTTNIRGVYFNYTDKLHFTNLSSDFSYTSTQINLKNTNLATQYSKLLGDITLNYKSGDFSRFNDRVIFDANIKQGNLALRDARVFYSDFGRNDILNFKTKLKGTLNNLSLRNTVLISKNGTNVNGNFFLKNIVNSERGFVFKADINQLTSNYEQLNALFPKLVSKTIPTDFKKLGVFTIRGNTVFSDEKLEADISLQSRIGYTSSNLTITNLDDIDSANYKGKVNFQNFNLGRFLGNKEFGTISFEGEVDGKSFNIEKINTDFKGLVSELTFRGYTYQNLDVNGQYQNNKFNGTIDADDENCKFNFIGLADFSTDVNRFDFKANISTIDLKKTNLFTRDSVSKLKGFISIDIQGNKIDDIVGKAIFENIVYTNPKKSFTFNEFSLTSELQDDIKNIQINSKDIAEGYIKGKFKFEELMPVVQNALGSMYTNYVPYKVSDDQFLDFNFNMHNKVFEIFYPKITISENTILKGKIKSNKNRVKLQINAPKVLAFDNEVINFKLRTDNQNALYNSHLTADKIVTGPYKIHKFNLLNKNQKDTLYFKSVFKGGNNQKENYNLDFYYSIDSLGKSVVGFDKSSFVIKNNLWKINPSKDFSSKVVFDLEKKEYNFSPFKLTSGNQKLEFSGFLIGQEEKKLVADLENVNLKSILPDIDSLDLKGTLSGKIDFLQQNGLYNPKGTLVIDNFHINDLKQGNLALDVQGNNSIENYEVTLSLQREKVKNISATGSIDISTKKPTIDLDVNMEDFELDAFSPLGQDILSSVRGKASGNFAVKGFLGKPSLNGDLVLKGAGLKFPYLNVDFDFEGESDIQLRGNRYIFNNIQLRDTKHSTRGIFKGSISHKDFNAWTMDLEIDTDNLLVLDTEETEESMYYGTGFLDGTATVKGPVEQLVIDINGTTKEGTKFIIPLKDNENISNYKLIHFKGEEVVLNNNNNKSNEFEAIKGIKLNMDLAVTRDAEAQVVIDKDNGSQLSGRGNGNIQIVIDTRGAFNMYGDLIIESGVYDFKYGGLVNKPFVIQKGGSVSWNGSPFDANLNLVAIYKAKGNPAVLLENFNSNRNIEVDLVTKITGGLFNSKQELDIDLPNVDPSIKSELDFVLGSNDVNEKTTQFISLLTLGNFVNPDKVNFDSNAVVTSTASNAIAAAFSSLLNNPNSKFQLGVGYKQGNNDIEQQNLNVDNQVDLSLTTKISDRVVVNGKVGVPVGTKTQSSVVGEVKVEVLLNKEGNFRGVIFNRQNEIRFSTEEEGYTQGIGLSYQVNFNTLSDLFKQVKSTIKSKKKKETPKDSVLVTNSSLVKFKNNK